MKFKVKNTKDKDIGIYKTLYIKESLVKKIDKIATKNNTSFNNVVISMIEYALNEEDQK